MIDLAKWAEQEVQALISIGTNPIDAQHTVDWILKNLPPGADPRTWIPTPADLARTELSDKEAVSDAKATWIERKPRKIKRLLTPTVK
jgi:hypothetical protein